MDLAHTLALTVRQGIPRPQAGAFTLQQRAWFLLQLAGLRPAEVGRAILDFTTAVVPAPLDVRGNAQHWMIRTADAALERTLPTWNARFETEETWNTIYVDRMVPAWQPYYKDTGATRRGVPMAVVKRKQENQARRAYAKALANWAYAFREEGEEFYLKLLNTTEAFAKATQEFLGYVGLGLHQFVGPFSMHIMALCSNPGIAGVYSLSERFTVWTIPDPPIIPTPYRPSLNQDVMAVFCRDLYLSLPQPPADRLNFILDGVLEAYLHPAYAAPPRSYLHVELRDGGVYLHTHIEEVSHVVHPRAVEWAFPVVYPESPFVDTLAVADLFLFGVPGDFPIAFLTIELAEIAYPTPKPLLLVYRDPSGSEARILDDHVGTRITIGPPAPGETIQLRFRAAAFTRPFPRYRAAGHFWYTDTAGNESNHASWLVQAPGPTADNYRIGRTTPQEPDTEVIAIPSLFALGHAGGDPLASCTFVQHRVLNNLYVMLLKLHRSDGGASDIELVGLDVLVTVPIPPPGVSWQVILEAHGIAATLPLPVIFSGELWFTDVDGVQSNHAQWLISTQ